MIRDKDAVLFDLDGTLIDTAPDMVRVLHEMTADYGAPTLPYERVRSYVSNGSLGLVRLGFPDADEAEQRRLQAEYLERYTDNTCRDSRVFDGLEPFLDALDDASIVWGVVTNKPTVMTASLLDGLKLTSRMACIVCGDTLPQRKPDPAPLFLGARQAGVAPRNVVYVGDAERDIAAGKAAGMATVAAGFGYIVESDSAASWGADMVARDVAELIDLLATAVDLQQRQFEQTASR